jgi:hypothetical protein
MKEPIEGTNWFFVDEAGDATFYDRRGHLIVGQEGCSPILLLGFLETTDPISMRQAIQKLHAEIKTDPYLQTIPSIAKTHKAFHAKDDSPEVKHLVFNALAKLDFKTQFVVARKIEGVFRSKFHGSEWRFYDELVSRLFQNALHRYTRNCIYFAQRGSRKRQAPLQAAIKKGIATFESRWNTTVESEYLVFSQTPPSEMCLQVIDYMNWAVYRAFVNREMRYYRFVESKVSFLLDLYDTKNYPRNFYSRENPFDIEKASPL